MVNKRYSLKIVNLYLFEILQVTFRGNISTKTKYIIKYSSIFKNQFSHLTFWQLIRPTAIDFAQIYLFEILLVTFPRRRNTW